MSTASIYLFSQRVITTAIFKTSHRKLIYETMIKNLDIRAKPSLSISKFFDYDGNTYGIQPDGSNTI